ncbi:MAG: PKD domain-containing protein, partial [Thermoplasmata archaeon]|nr:PKD domain-containing protein [Thermoplasmata archaeon]
VAAPDPVAAGSSVELTAIIDGGVPPYTASWEFGDNASATGLTVWHAFRVAGAYTVHLVVLDSANQTARNQTTVTVTVAPPATPSPSGGGSSGAFPGAWSGTVGLAAVALGLGGAEIVMARWAVRLWRRTSSPSPSAPPS